MDHDSARAVSRAVRRAARTSEAPLLLAVSGGLDSMALLVAMARTCHARVAGVATFDHGTGPAATAAAAHVARVAGGLGLPVLVGRMTTPSPAPDGLEAAWRAARHAFLSETATAAGARVTTAHTCDDQVETVLMRVLRGSGTRGLAALEAPSPIVRPFLALRREVLRAYLVDAGVPWVDDPTNDSPAFLRNRVRHDLLPALRRADPGLETSLLATGRAAARWRAEVDALVDRVVQPTVDAGGLSVATTELAGYDRDSVAMIWGALAGRVGLALDRRGTHRLASFIMKEPSGGRIPLSGGWCLEAGAGAYRLRRAVRPMAAPATLPAMGTMEWGRFRFRVAGRAEPDPARCWTASLPADVSVRVRAWSAGDRLAPAGGQARRRVARYLSDVGLAGMDRAGWPVVVVGDGRGEDVVWIPGVRRSDAATERSGRPVRHYVCERIAP